MTKKEFLSLANFTPYTGSGSRDNNVNAVFFEWKAGELDGKYFGGFKYCFYGRATLCPKKVLLNTMYAYVSGKITDSDVPYWINMKIAETDAERFKVPLSWKW